MKNIVITGANGFIGSNLANSLKDEYKITACVRKSSDISLLDDKNNIEFIDYDSKESIASALNHKEILIHCAAITRGKDWYEFKKNNISLTEKLVMIANQTESIKQIIFLSSQAAAGPAVTAKPKEESDVCNPISLYGKSKLLAEHQIKKQSQKPYTIVRPAAVYGPGDKDFLQYFKLINKGISLSAGKQKKFLNLIFVEELVSLIDKCILNEKAFNRIFFATDGKIHSWISFIKTLKKVMQKKVKHITIPEKVLLKTAQIVEITTHFQKRQPLLNPEKVNEMIQSFWLASNQQSINLLDFTTNSLLEKNLEKTYLWYQEKKWL